MLSNGPFLKGRTKLVEFSVSSNFNSTTWDSTLNLDKVQTLSGATKVDTMGGGIFLQSLNIEIAENKSWILDIEITALQKMNSPNKYKIRRFRTKELVIMTPVL